jgi:hypothetical protein
MVPEKRASQILGCNSALIAANDFGDQPAEKTWRNKPVMA